MYILELIDVSPRSATSKVATENTRPALKSPAWLVVFVVVLAATTISLPCIASDQAETTLTVRVIDNKDGKALKGVSLGLVTWDEKGQHFLLSAITDAEGAAIFHLSIPIPERIGITYSPNEVWACSDIAFPTIPILKSGIVAQYKCNDRRRLKWTAPPKAGELVVFAKRVSLWERMRRELP